MLYSSVAFFMLYQTTLVSPAPVILYWRTGKEKKRKKTTIGLGGHRSIWCLKKAMCTYMHVYSICTKNCFTGCTVLCLVVKIGFSFCLKCCMSNFTWSPSQKDFWELVASPCSSDHTVTPHENSEFSNLLCSCSLKFCCSLCCHLSSGHTVHSVHGWRSEFWS